MLLLNEHKIVLITPHKCASTTLNETLPPKVNAQLILGPQGPYKQCGFDFDDVIGKHSTFIPFWCRTWRKVMMVRNPYDRFVSLWKHYCKYHDHPVAFEFFVDVVQGYKETPPQGWFYTWRMRDFIESVDRTVELVDVTDLDKLPSILGITLEEPLPRLHTTDHEDYKSYYTPALYRKVHDLA